MSAFQVGERFKQEVRNARVIGEFAVKIASQKLPGLAWQAISRIRSAAYPQVQSRIQPMISPPSIPNPETMLDQPLDDYDLLAGSQIMELLVTLDHETLKQIIQYESQTRKRQSIISKAQSLLLQS